MKYLVVVLWIAVTSNALAQDDVQFRIVSFSEGVTIDGKEPKIGANVMKDQKRVEVPANGYLGGITNEGKVFKITQSSNVNRVMTNNQIKPAMQFYYTYPQHISVSSVSKGNRFIVGDSLFLNWNIEYDDVDDSTTMKFSDILYQEIISVRVKNNYALIDIGPLLDQQPNVVLELTCLVDTKGRRPKEAHSGLLALQHPSREQFAGISFDLQRLPQTSDRPFYESALYLLNDFTYDSSACLYRILKSKQTTADPILARYYEVMFEKNDLKSLRE